MFTENLSAFFNTNEHGEVATYTQQGGGIPVGVNGIFEADYIDPLHLVQSEKSTFLCKLVDMPAVKDGDALIARSKSFLIRIPEKDWGGGVGLVLLHLEEQ